MANILWLIKRLEIFANKTPACNELDEALILIIKTLHLSSFDNKIKSFQKYNEIKLTSTLYGLTPFIDENGIIR